MKQIINSDGISYIIKKIKKIENVDIIIDSIETEFCYDIGHDRIWICYKYFGLYGFKYTKSIIINKTNYDRYIKLKTIQLC